MQNSLRFENHHICFGKRAKMYVKYDGGTSTIYEKSTSAQIGGSNLKAMKNTSNQPTRVKGNMGMVSSSWFKL